MTGGMGPAGPVFRGGQGRLCGGPTAKKGAMGQITRRTMRPDDEGSRIQLPAEAVKAVPRGQVSTPACACCRRTGRPYVLCTELHILEGTGSAYFIL